MLSIAQWSDQAISDFARSSLPAEDTGGGPGVEGWLAGVMNGGNDGFTSPAIVGINNHAEAAYRWEPQTGGLVIETYDSNHPFSAAEDSDTTGKTHVAALTGSPTGSWLRVLSDGQVRIPDTTFLSSGATSLLVFPARALEGTLSYGRALVGAQTSVTLASNTQVGQVTGPTGKPVALGSSTSAVAEPFLSATSASDDPGTAQLVLKDADTVTLGSTGTIGGSWQGAAADATLSSSSGHVDVRFDPRSHQLRLTRAKGQSAPKHVTLSITERESNGASRVVTVTGPLPVTVAVDSAVKLSAPSGGRYTIALSDYSTKTVQTAALGAVAAPKGATLTLSPSWPAVATTTTRATLHHGHTTKVLTLRDHLKAPKAKVARIAVKGATVQITLSVPTLASGQGQINLTASARGISAVRSTLSTGGRAHTSTVMLHLKHALAKHTRLTVTVTTINGGPSPSETSTATHSG